MMWGCDEGVGMIVDWREGREEFGSGRADYLLTPAKKDGWRWLALIFTLGVWGVLGFLRLWPSPYAP
jgi:hypothetical protein